MSLGTFCSRVINPIKQYYNTLRESNRTHVYVYSKLVYLKSFEPILSHVCRKSLKCPVACYRSSSVRFMILLFKNFYWYGPLRKLIYSGVRAGTRHPPPQWPSNFYLLLDRHPFFMYFIRNHISFHFSMVCFSAVYYAFIIYN